MRPATDPRWSCPHPDRHGAVLGLAGGGEVEIELDGAAIRIAPVAGTELREDDGLLVIPATGTSIDDTLVRELIDADRHGR